MVIHVGTVPTAQPQVVESAETVTLLFPPEALNEPLGLERLKAQPFWLIVNVSTVEPPVIVSVALREEPVALPVTLKLTVPFPLPEAPEIIVIQPALLTADQVQPLVALTATLPGPPLELKEPLEAPRE